MLVVSATQDKYSRDADEVCATAASRTAHLAPNPSSNIIAIRGGHALTRERFDAIVERVASR